MNSQNIPRDSISRFITVIIPAGAVNNITEELKREFGIERFYTNSARGMTLVDSKLIGKFIYIEKQIITILVDKGDSDKVFEYLYHRLEIAEMPGSFIYMGEARYLTRMNLPQ